MSFNLKRRSFLQALIAAPVAVPVLVPVIAKANELIVPPEFELSRVRLDPGILFEYEMLIRESVAVGYEIPEGMKLVDVKHWDYSTTYIDASEIQSKFGQFLHSTDQQSVTFEGYGCWSVNYWEDFVNMQEITVYAMVAGELVAFTGTITRYEARVGEYVVGPMAIPRG